MVYLGGVLIYQLHHYTRVECGMRVSTSERRERGKGRAPRRSKGAEPSPERAELALCAAGGLRAKYEANIRVDIADPALGFRFEDTLVQAFPMRRIHPSTRC